MTGFLNPPPGHPHYMPDTARAEALEAKLRPSLEDYQEDEEPQMSTTAAAKYTELKAKIANARKEMETTAKNAFTEMSAELFEQNPTLQSFSWTQYTPYFNDGDPCVFRCNGSYPDVTILVNGEIFGRSDREDSTKPKSFEDYERTFKSLGGSVDSYQSGGKTVAYDRAAKVITVDGVPVRTHQQLYDMTRPTEKIVGAFLEAFDDEDMEVMFGDHVKVTAHRNGKIETEEYSHD
jgi:hypothetical protein